ncbi:MAG TPA: phosphatase PAP2 family protein [Variovorax sp.]|nr:phosphatase PAP2 family protein [Variovorax sp.]
MLTWLGDSGLLLPVAVFVALVLLRVGHGLRRPALTWCVVFGSCGLAVMASKLAFMGWGIGSARFNFTGFSGHTAIGTALWPVALWLMATAWQRRHPPAALAAGVSGTSAREAPGRPGGGAAGLHPGHMAADDAGDQLRRAAVLAGWVLGGAIGISRLALRAHSISEVATGFLVGLVASTVFLALVWRRTRPPRAHPALLLVLLVPLAFFGPDAPAPTHQLLERIAMRLAGIDRPFKRMDLFGPERGGTRGSVDAPRAGPPRGPALPGG